MNRNLLWSLCAFVLVAALVIADPALAADMQRVEGQVREKIPAGRFLAAAYGIIWAGVLGYVAMIARRLTRVQAELRELRAKADAQLPR